MKVILSMLLNLEFLKQFKTQLSPHGFLTQSKLVFHRPNRVH